MEGTVYHRVYIHNKISKLTETMRNNLETGQIKDRKQLHPLKANCCKRMKQGGY